jgi:hypothetical protein
MKKSSVHFERGTCGPCVWRVAYVFPTSKGPGSLQPSQPHTAMVNLGFSRAISQRTVEILRYNLTRLVTPCNSSFEMFIRAATGI